MINKVESSLNEEVSIDITAFESENGAYEFFIQKKFEGYIRFTLTGDQFEELVNILTLIKC